MQSMQAPVQEPVQSQEQMLLSADEVAARLGIDL